TKSNHFLQDRHVQRTQTFTGILGVREQDTAVVEGMGAIADRTKEHLGTSDSAIIAMRRYLVNSAKAFVEGREPQEPYDGGLYRVRAWSYELSRNIDFMESDKVRELMGTMVV
ncbi:MAG: Rieske (2Fe-2S) domain-containing protein, partial [Chloroflexota bacterium]|nr:Rieske (2Fe-2S) domain-containing protein [Chloroflexota bacterium]